MRILVFGMNGQLGWQCVKDLPGAIGVDRACLDAATPSIKDDLNQLLDRYQPDVVINAIAYTAVDRAEQERELAFRINADFPSQLAKLVAKALLIHISSDYVFDGHSSQAYQESDPPAPLSVYGASKRAGELAILESGANALVLRSTWLIGEQGQNFAKSILRLACTRSELWVVEDQRGVPTPTPFLVAQIASALRLNDKGPRGLFHLVPAGQTDWYRYAKHILEKAQLHRRWQSILRVRASALEAITTDQYPLAAARPRNSCLDTGRWKQVFGLEQLPHYQQVLDPVLDRILEKEPVPSQVP